MRSCFPNFSGPGATLDPIEKIRNPYDISTWGPACGRGVPYKDVGAVTDGAKEQRRSISSGRKHRGSAFEDFEKAEK